jgi:hypothetical protein
MLQAVSKDPRTQNQVAGILLMREGEKRLTNHALRRYDQLVAENYPICDATYLIALCEDAG